MKYILRKDSKLLECPVAEVEAKYLRAASTRLTGLSDEDYLSSFAVVLRTGAHFCYVLDGNSVLWLIQWQPGLIVLKLSPQGPMQWAAIRSPIPDFGGRTPLPEDGSPDNYDDDQNPQYTLIYTPVDAAIDPDCAEQFSYCDQQTISIFDAAIAHVNTLEAGLESRIGEEELRAWIDQCKLHIDLMCGNGQRIETK
jgi:hypothetical protein